MLPDKVETLGHQPVSHWEIRSLDSDNSEKRGNTDATGALGDGISRAVTWPGGAQGLNSATITIFVASNKNIRDATSLHMGVGVCVWPWEELTRHAISSCSGPSRPARYPALQLRRALCALML